ncbi:MAG: hypothetical protein ABI440_01175 [Casimicrobiaceae bacterium]
MGGRYGAFTFCDRITDYVPARRARAAFAVPTALDCFSPCLVAEATGQLAAWVAMAHIGFRGRPVAALAHDVCLDSVVRPGEVLLLTVEIEECNDANVFYQGQARVGERSVVRLIDCLGPMLPQDEYDAPDDLAREFALLCGEGEVPGRFEGVGAHAMETTAAAAGTRSALLHIPADAPYFVDHFPRRPVFPATLLLDHAIRVAGQLVDGDTPGAHRASRVTNVKMRGFIRPGENVLLKTTRVTSDDDAPRVKLIAMVGERKMATAQITFARVDQEAA